MTHRVSYVRWCSLVRLVVVPRTKLCYLIQALENVLKQQILCTSLQTQKIFSNTKFCILLPFQLKKFSLTPNLVPMSFKAFTTLNFVYVSFPIWKIFSEGKVFSLFFQIEKFSQDHHSIFQLRILFCIQFFGYNFFTNVHFFHIFFKVGKII